MALNCLCSSERQLCLGTVSSETVVHLGNGRNKPTGRMGEASSSQGGATPRAEAYYQSHVTCCSKNPLLSAAMLGDALVEAFLQPGSDLSLPAFCRTLQHPKDFYVCLMNYLWTLDCKYGAERNRQAGWVHLANVRSSHNSWIIILENQKCPFCSGIILHTDSLCSAGWVRSRVNMGSWNSWKPGKLRVSKQWDTSLWIMVKVLVLQVKQKSSWPCTLGAVGLGLFLHDGKVSKWPPQNFSVPWHYGEALLLMTWSW